MELNCSDFSRIYRSNTPRKTSTTMPSAASRRKHAIRRQIEWYQECRQAGIDYQPLASGNVTN